jgi:hypothetical protein
MRHPLIRQTPQQVRGVINASTITRYFVKEIVISRRRLCHAFVVGFFLLEGGAYFTNCVKAMGQITLFQICH